MDVVILPTAADVGAHAADLVAAHIARKPDTVLGVATGSSPVGIYRELARRQQEGALDLGGIRCFALDEYVGLPPGHPGSYATFLEREVARPFRLPRSRVRLPDGRAGDLERACEDYERAIAEAGGIDLQILGIGTNGHIGFNEPVSSLSSRTRVKALSAQTRTDNARFFADDEEVPTHCVTQGLGTILEARQVVLVAQGERKASAVAAAVEGPVSSMCPASVLQFHRRATVVLDEPAAGGLALGDYYRFVLQAKDRFRGRA
ncbi:glucosamine-6-phosphate deaminase [Kocuria dechangensis]|uniref:Glucosamine-6-phosphate deaminase n=1 Tax=Kocuria dechangensis TaxID=1176249 RepID=A0A917GVG7_9MICC|nr:glucosamine-6-phosphate deaminase [Kocuria dechangensis]GGG58278.1 glucosamine-6-phosphate deaminase [Kocuria dechangensis]